MRSLFCAFTGERRREKTHKRLTLCVFDAYTIRCKYIPPNVLFMEGIAVPL